MGSDITGVLGMQEAPDSGQRLRDGTVSRAAGWGRVSRAGRGWLYMTGWPLRHKAAPGSHVHREPTTWQVLSFRPSLGPGERGSASPGKVIHLQHRLGGSGLRQGDEVARGRT